MSGLFGSLNNSVKALNAQTRGVETAGRNLANVNNTDYARQRVIFGDRGTVQTTMGPMSLGLEAMGIQQIRDTLLDQQLTREVSLTAKLDTLHSALDSAQAGLGQSVDRTSGVSSASGGSSGIAESMADFFNAFQSFAAKPTDVGEKQTLIQKAMILSERLQLTDSRLEQVQEDMSTQISSDVDQVNRILETIATLNSEISRFEQNFPGGAADLRDARQAQLEDLAKLMNFETRPQAGYPGQIQVFTHDSGGAEILLVDLGSPATIALDAAVTTPTVTPPVGPAAVANITSGSIAGAFEARDVHLQNLRDEIDLLAEQLVTSVNAAYAPSGNNFFNPAGLAAGTISIAAGLSASTLVAGTGASGDNSIALAVGALAFQTFSTGGGDLIDGTFSQHYTKTVTNMGQALSGVTARLRDQETIEQLVRTQRDAISGVSLDEEMADLMKYQRAFQANSRVVTTIDNLLDVIVNQLIR